ncbi:MAG TPA: carboxymuconolactone decarboxylase family protein [Streptosporangiaceae bacterium]
MNEPAAGADRAGPGAGRLPTLKPDDLTPDQRALHSRIMTGPRREHATFFPVADDDGVLSGPYRAMLLSPDVGGALERVGVAVRYESTVPPAVRELAILMVARHCRCQVEWRAHEALARASGVPGVTIETLAAGDPPTLVGDEARVTHAFVHELLVDNRVSDETFGRAVALLSLAGVFELIVTVGYYQIIAGVNNAFDLSG